MASTHPLKTFANGNDPLPEHLQQSLNDYLAELDRRIAANQRERKAVREAIDLLKFDIEALERKIESLEGVETGLERGNEVLQEQKARFGCIFAPIRRIPPEIMAHIFSFAIVNRHRLVGLNGRASFLCIRSVCRLWRATSFSTPSLWRAVGLDAAAHTQRGPSTWNHLVSWFSHAGTGAPLRLNILVSSPSHGVDLLDIISRFELNLTTTEIDLSQSSGHWDTLSLEILTARYRNPLPIKTLVVILRSQPQDVLQPPHTISLAQRFPNLWKLHLSQFSGSPPSLISVAFTHPSLTFLTLFNVALTSQGLMSLLSGLPRLSTLRLPACVARIPDSHSSWYTHASLKEVFFTKTLPESLFDCASFPALRSVYLDGCRSTPEPSVFGRKLGRLLQRCEGPLGVYIVHAFPRQLVRNILEANAAITRIALPGPSSLETDPLGSCGHRHIVSVPPSLTDIEFTDRAMLDTLWHVSNFARRVKSRLAKGQVLSIWKPYRDRPLYKIDSVKRLDIDPAVLYILAKKGMCPHELSACYAD
jgi:F-box-like